MSELHRKIEEFATGKYQGNAGRALWNLLGHAWNDDAVTDRTLGVPTGKRSSLYDMIQDAIDARDPTRMLALCDQAEIAGVGAELCDLTRRALHGQFPRVK